MEEKEFYYMIIYRSGNEEYYFTCRTMEEVNTLVYAMGKPTIIKKVWYHEQTKTYET